MKKLTLGLLALAAGTALAAAPFTRSWAVTARPPGRTLTGASARHTYFQIRPAIVDAPESPAKTRSTGTTRAVVIPVDFRDKPAAREVYTPDSLEAKFFGDQTGSLKSYFHETSYGKLLLTGYVTEWVRSACRHRDIVNRDLTPGTKDDHGLDTSSDALAPAVCEFPLNIWGLVKDAVGQADAAVDFAAYDGDGDGYVDALFIVHAGIGAEIEPDSPYGNSEDYIWSLQSSLDYYAPTRGTYADGVRIGPFVIVPELSEIGVYGHEFCHLLGLPDLYNSLTGDPVVGSLCLMDTGAWLGPQGREGSRPGHLSAFMKSILGWVTPEVVCLGCEGPDQIVGAQIAAVSTNAVAYTLLTNPGGVDWTPYGTGTGEYFLIENRQRTQGYFDFYLDGHGLVIWKIDESRADNNTARARLADVIQADGESMDPDSGVPRLPGDPTDFWPGALGKQAFTPYSVPPSNLSGGRFSGAAVENIAEDQTGLATADLRIGLAQRGSTYAYPNPYSLAEGAPMRIVFLPEIGPAEPYSFDVTLFDLEGNPVRKLEGTGEVQRDGTALWDGRDESGSEVSPGLYIYYVRSSGREARGVVVIKP